MALKLLNALWWISELDWQVPACELRCKTGRLKTYNLLRLRNVIVMALANVKLEWDSKNTPALALEAQQQFTSSSELRTSNNRI